MIKIFFILLIFLLQIKECLGQWYIEQSLPLNSGSYSIQNAYGNNQSFHYGDNYNINNSNIILWYGPYNNYLGRSSRHHNGYYHYDRHNRYIARTNMNSRYDYRYRYYQRAQQMKKKYWRYFHQ